MGKHEKERDGFKSRTGFILACIGSAVGMGNIWRFPYMVSDWGGMTFLIPYILFVILIASTGVIEEMALGRAAKGGPIKAFGVCTDLHTVLQNSSMRNPESSRARSSCSSHVSYHNRFFLHNVQCSTSHVHYN